MNAWDFVQSKAEDDQSWIAARHPLLHREGLQFEPPHDQLGGAGSEIRQKVNYNGNMKHLMLQFADKCVPYEVFVKDLAREIVALQTDALRLPNDIVSQNKAFKLFGEGNVRRWVKEEKLVPVSKRPGKIEYRIFDLKRLQERQQDYY